mmetsp:Transcript_44300/g.125353  ORF Transcript_44300/g.125353 Transcript_44300/m.125353 type:complete len:284 (-) Transcript_44300:296-1147(-)
MPRMAHFAHQLREQNVTAETGEDVGHAEEQCPERSHVCVVDGHHRRLNAPPLPQRICRQHQVGPARQKTSRRHQRPSMEGRHEQSQRQVDGEGDVPPLRAVQPNANNLLRENEGELRLLEDRVADAVDEQLEDLHEADERGEPWAIQADGKLSVTASTTRLHLPILRLFFVERRVLAEPAQHQPRVPAIERRQDKQHKGWQPTEECHSPGQQIRPVEEQERFHARVARREVPGHAGVARLDRVVITIRCSHRLVGPHSGRKVLVEMVVGEIHVKVWAVGRRRV